MAGHFRHWPTYYDVDDNGCWIWRGIRNGKDRYGTAGKTLAHRYFYELHKGPIPEGLQIDHLCRRKACVNPDHLEAVTSRVNNNRRPYSLTQRTHCKEGHVLSPDNVGRYNDKRGYVVSYCRTCQREKDRRIYWTKKSAG